MAQNPYQSGIPHKPGTGWIKSVSYLMDEQFRLPGTRFRFGIDPIINLFPVLGDFTGFLISAGMLLAVARNGASSKLVALMSINILVDSIIGPIPVIGNIFDFYFKSNTRNLKLMQEYFVQGKHQGSGKNTIIIALIILVLILGLLIYGLIELSAWILSWF
ncbi:hypothetical protein GCM10011387_04140 [Pedobacter quisquiliarum]|jgi:hypothetical protein|uniref:DUF4112 domain-containing protein n=1 Tax=Pedobacter quisquiliarum TaxID=1834438 RepID=A0A916U0Z4_9SPHI|nr:DUF4112 domain-containing protein [Pedobacter quisquiliarum]GGC53750.1 hypothetical protein GCM10011387_04140 [Pedobacter quisquiliarum]